MVGGGQADVFKVTHKPSGQVVALKKLRDRHPLPRQVARMGREFELGRRLHGNPHAMTVLDFDPKNTWFVMPFAEATAEQCRERFTDIPTLHSLLAALCSVLAVAHREGWVHRDIKPANVLLLNGRWVLADWGIVKRPTGRTTDAQRTRVGVFLGSDGFAAPELDNDAHAVGPTADIYSLGQLATSGASVSSRCLTPVRVALAPGLSSCQNSSARLPGHLRVDPSRYRKLRRGAQRIPRAVS
ncbi:protein kinase-like protein [Streptomyces sp. Ag82_O1-15]|uniref:protein kinase domain-containing protein n=1 Tax=Streptomyces sp. Ag82_O1-15 TaxID=1938855 RepID=UPI000BD1EB52|nr:protein kinase-like protein [Streptomyces sp. Ag82_O1-15]